MSNLKWNFQTFKSGQAEDHDEKPLLPTGITQEDDLQSNEEQENEPLYPLGIEIED